jgi:hypothetical protein
VARSQRSKRLRSTKSRCMGTKKGRKNSLAKPEKLQGRAKEARLKREQKDGGKVEAYHPFKQLIPLQVPVPKRHGRTRQITCISNVWALVLRGCGQGQESDKPNELKDTRVSNPFFDRQRKDVGEDWELRHEMDNSGLSKDIIPKQTVVVSAGTL